MERWYVVHTQPHAEAKAVWHLRNQGFEPYLPRLAKKRRHARRVDWVAAPLFPSYLFVRLDLERARWRAIRSTVGVLDLVLNGERPAAVPVGVVEEIRAREDERGYVVLPAPVFDPGQKVHLLDGALDGQTGIFEGMSDEARVVVLLELLGREVRVRVPLQMVRAVA